MQLTTAADPQSTTRTSQVPGRGWSLVRGGDDLRPLLSTRSSCTPVGWLCC
jgi:hypothetical protein